MAKKDLTKNVGAAISDAVAAQLQAEKQLKSAQELRRLIGDPRIRVQVPTVKISGNSQQFSPISRRYHVG